MLMLKLEDQSIASLVGKTTLFAIGAVEQMFKAMSAGLYGTHMVYKGWHHPISWAI